jgi:hypothetical protein
MARLFGIIESNYVHLRQQGAHRFVWARIGRVASRRLELNDGNGWHPAAHCNPDPIETRPHTSVLDWELAPHRSDARLFERKQGVSCIDTLFVAFGGQRFALDALLKCMIGDSPNRQRIFASCF